MDQLLRLSQKTVKIEDLQEISTVIFLRKQFQELCGKHISKKMAKRSRPETFQVIGQLATATSTTSEL